MLILHQMLRVCLKASKLVKITKTVIPGEGSAKL